MGSNNTKETFKWHDNRNKKLVIRASIVAMIGLVSEEILSGLNHYVYDYKLMETAWYSICNTVCMFILLVGLVYGIAVFQTDRYYKRLAEKSEGKVAKNE